MIYEVYMGFLLCFYGEYKTSTIILKQKGLMINSSLFHFPTFLNNEEKLEEKIELERDLAEFHMLKIPSWILATIAIDVPN
jgi:hypothetical protein